MISPINRGLVKNGLFNADDRQTFKKAFYVHEGKRVIVTVKRETKSRSNPQNKYYWGVVVKLLSDHTGYNVDEMHDALRIKFLTIRENKIPTVKSTTDLSTVEFEEYMTNIRQWASTELSVYVPDPNECEY